MAQQPDNNAFQPTLRENRIMAGGLTLFELDDQGRLIFEDRYRNRCAARGTPDVPVSLMALLDVILAHYRLEPPDRF